MKTPHNASFGQGIAGIAQAVTLFLLTSSAANAVNATWSNGAGDNAWLSVANWNGSSYPGATSGFSSTETATFGSAGSGSVGLGGTVNVQNIVIGVNGGNAGAFTLGNSGNALNLTSGGSITVNRGVTSAQAIGAAINLSTTSNSTYAFINNAASTLTIGGSVTSSQNSGNVTTLTLGGAGNGVISGALGGAGTAGDAGLAVTKNGSGTWTLSGASTYSGTTRINGGQLVLDYSTHTPISSAAPLVINGGVLTFRGASTGATAATVGGLAIGSASASNNKLVLDSNGGSGIALTIGTLSAYTSSLSSNLIDYSSSSGNTVTVSALGSGLAVASNSVLMGGAAGNYRATIIVKDADGYGFATLSGATSGTLGRLTAGTNVTASNTSTTVNYRITTSGTVTRTANFDFETLTIDSTQGDVTLNMGTYTLAATSNGGRGILVTGAHDVTIAGTGATGAALIVNNYGTGTLFVSVPSATFGTTFAGTGFTDFSGTITSTAGQAGSGFSIVGGIVRISKAQTLSTETPYLVSAGGVLEIGADLNDTAAGDFTAAIGTTKGKIRFIGDSGLSAAGADRVVNFGGASAAVTWGSAGFLTDVDGTTDGGYTLKLSSAKSNATLTIENAIALGSNTSRVVDVANGSAAIDAVLSGTISGGASLTKTGDGTLALTAANTYTGATHVDAGRLNVDGVLASGVVNVRNGATLGGSGTASGVVTVNGATINGSGLNLGSATFSGNSILSGTTTAAAGYVVASGTTRANGVTASGVTVSAGALLTGTGTVGNVVVSGTLSGSLSAGAISGSGHVAPGNSPGILSATSVSGGTGLVFDFEFTKLGSPIFSDPLASGNDVLLLTGGMPFTLALTAGNTVNIYLASAVSGDVYQGGFLTSLSASELLNQVKDAAFVYYVLDGDGSTNTGGDTLYNGYYYKTLDSALVSLSTIAVSSASAPLDGSELQIAVVPEPSTWALIGGGMGILLCFQGYRRKA